MAFNNRPQGTAYVPDGYTGMTPEETQRRQNLALEAMITSSKQRYSVYTQGEGRTVINGIANSFIEQYIRANGQEPSEEQVKTAINSGVAGGQSGTTGQPYDPKTFVKPAVDATNPLSGGLPPTTNVVSPTTTQPNGGSPLASTPSSPFPGTPGSTVAPPLTPGTPPPPPVDPMQKLRDAMIEAKKLIPTRASLTPDAQASVDPLANQARANLQQDVARKGAEDQKALARQLASRGRIGGPASEALKGQLTSQLNSSLTQGLSQVESTRLSEVNRIVQSEIDSSTTFADKQFTAAAGLIAMGANADETIRTMGVAFQNDLSKMAIQNRFVAEQAATDRTFRVQLQQMGQDFEQLMAKFKLDEASKGQTLGFLNSIFNTVGSVASFYLNPLKALGGK